MPEGEPGDPPLPTAGAPEPARPEPPPRADPEPAKPTQPTSVEAANLLPADVAALVGATPDEAAALAGPVAKITPGEEPRAEDVLRARVLSAGTPAPPRPARARLTPATLVALLLLVVSAGLSLTFVLARGGVALPTSPPTRGPVAGTSASASPSAPAAPLATPSLAPVSTPTTTVPSSGAPTPAPTSRPSPTSDRYDVLVACPNTPGCWIYTIRQGDNLVSIANWFGVPLATMYEMNPGLRTTTIRAGMQIRIPTPSR